MRTFLVESCLRAGDRHESKHFDRDTSGTTNNQRGTTPSSTCTSTPPSSNVPRAHGGGGEAVRLLEELLTAQGGVVVSKELTRLCGHWLRLPRTRRPLVRGVSTPRDYPGIGSITIET